jgi:hypothetical protein|tara:strand:+ start:495 stop:1067 length:573 start_codon:yes stop_codon:yes gene_type:complete
MKTYILNIIPKAQRFSKKLDNLSLLTKHNWIGVNEEADKSTKNTYIFRANKELIVSKGGRVEKWKYEDLGHNTLLIDKKDNTYLFRPEYLDENEKIISLRIDGTNEFAFLVEEETYSNNELWSQELIINYLDKTTNIFRGEEDCGNENQFMKRKYNENWIKDLNICPACGESGVKNLTTCPDCGLNLFIA